MLTALRSWIGLLLCCVCMALNAVESGVVIVNYPQYGGGYPYGITYEEASIRIETSQSDATWEIVANGVIVRNGQGPAFLHVRPNVTYQIRVAPQEGYRVSISPTTFTPRYGEQIQVRIDFRAAYGRIAIDAPMNGTETVKITVLQLPRRMAPIQASVRAHGKRITWQSSSLPTGAYEVLYQLPSYFKPVPPQQARVEENVTVVLHPEFIPARVLRVTSNQPEATFVLTKKDDGEVWQGHGAAYTFEQLLPGSYRLKLISPDPTTWIAPPEQNVVISPSQDAAIVVNYIPTGQLNIITNVPEATVSIRAVGGDRKALDEVITQGQRTFTLASGRYRLIFSPVRGEARLTYGSEHPPPQEVVVTANQTATVNAPYPTLTNPYATGSTSTPSQEITEASVTVVSSIAAAAFTIASEDGEETQSHRYQGKKVHIPLPPGSYTVTFDSLPNFKTPTSATFTLEEGQAATVMAVYKPQMDSVEIPAGMSISGDIFNEGAEDERPATHVFIDAFSMGTYEVTNSLFASWLNSALEQKNVVYKDGEVYDAEGVLLCRCLASVPWSQIYASRQGDGPWHFYPVIGKDDYPVIEVSWYGAVAYSKAQGGRLPSEAEWEKAAGVPPALDPQATLKKYRYGTSSDTINLQYANYRVTAADELGKQVRVLTTAVGNYNGENLIPLFTMDTKQQTRTVKAVSPYGAYDMSGNVWEWTNDWYSADYYSHMPTKNPQGPPSGTAKVAKGGSYDSTVPFIRVAARHPLSPSLPDPFTGFRVAFD